MVPSSPNGPCKSGKTISIARFFPPEVNPATSATTAGADSGTEGSVVPEISIGWPSGIRTHLPALVIPIRTGSYRVRSIAPSTPPAEIQEISCSLLRPPQIIATRFFIG